MEHALLIKEPEFEALVNGYLFTLLKPIAKAEYERGDTFWVKESIFTREGEPVTYESDLNGRRLRHHKHVPAMWMPRKYARWFLTITNVERAATWRITFQAVKNTTMYIEYDEKVHRELVSKGYKYLQQGRQLPAEAVGYAPETMLSHFEMIPHKDEPVDADVYDPLDSPETAAMIGGSIPNVFFWVNKALMPSN